MLTACARQRVFRDNVFTAYRSLRRMATINKSLPHVVRTESEPREHQLERVTLSNIKEVNPSVRLLRLSTVDPKHSISFMPGQWLDVYLPGLPQAGGFTITSTPFSSRPASYIHPYLELAVQKSRNPPAQWLWRPEEEILGTELRVRVGGSFHWPPRLGIGQIDRLVLVAGGVGINPLMSIFTFLIQIPESQRPKEIHFMYGSKATPELDAEKILFVPRLLDLVAAAADPLNVTFSLFLTGTGSDDGGLIEDGKLPNRTFARRMQEYDIQQALNGFRADIAVSRQRTVAYVCGPPKMTDELVSLIGRQQGMSANRVLCEKWW